MLLLIFLHVFNHVSNTKYYVKLLLAPETKRLNGLFSDYPKMDPIKIYKWKELSK